MTHHANTMSFTDLPEIPDPVDYFQGRGQDALPSPRNILLFIRRNRKDLQQRALQNRSHHRFVLCINLETEGRVHVNELTLSLSPGNALLIFPFQFHHFSKLNKGSLQWFFCTFELEPASQLDVLRNHVIRMEPESMDLLRSLCQHWHLPETGTEGTQLQTTLLQLLLRLREACPSRPLQASAARQDDLLRKVNQLLIETRGTRMTIGDVAESMGMSESRLRLRFKESAGIPLGKYLQNFRLNLAMSTLRNSDFPIAQVASLAGFASPQSFCRVFRKETGVTPATYRNSAATGAEAEGNARHAPGPGPKRKPM